MAKWGEDVNFGCIQTQGEYKLFIGTEIAKANNQKFQLPARYLAEGGNGWVLTLGFEKNMLLVPSESFFALEASLRSMNILNPAARLLQRLLVGNANLVVANANGEIELPALANFGDEVVLVGQGMYLEVWSANAWAEQMNTITSGSLQFDPSISICFGN